MSQELHYTSVPRGLKPGARGFCTVACTAGLSPTLAERLEGLSGYRAKFPPDSSYAAKNPVAWSHVRLSTAGQTISVVSRVGPAGLDYTDRPNKYAHHLVLEPTERPSGGPAWLLNQPGVMASEWTGPPLQIPVGLRIPVGDRLGGICRAWAAQVGDAGWGGVVAESFLHDPKRQVVLVFDPGSDVIGLFAEAIALLPVDRRWEVTFQTYFTGLPPGIACAWRGVLRDTPEERQARGNPDALLIDLAAPEGRASGGPLVHQARTGEAPARSSAPAPPPSGSTIVAAPAFPVAAPPRQTTPTAPPPLAAYEPYDLDPPSPPPVQRPRPRPRTSDSPGPSTRPIIAAAILGFVLGTTIGGAAVFILLEHRIGAAPTHTMNKAAKSASGASQAKAGQVSDKARVGGTTSPTDAPKTGDLPPGNPTPPPQGKEAAKELHIADHKEKSEVLEVLTEQKQTDNKDGEQPQVEAKGEKTPQQHEEKAADPPLSDKAKGPHLLNFWSIPPEPQDNDEQSIFKPFPLQDKLKKLSLIGGNDLVNEWGCKISGKLKSPTELEIFESPATAGSGDGTSSPEPIGVFAGDANQVRFKWLHISSRIVSSETRQALKDCVLDIEYENSDHVYLLLRGFELDAIDQMRVGPGTGNNKTPYNKQWMIKLYHPSNNDQWKTSRRRGYIYKFSLFNFDKSESLVESFQELENKLTSPDGMVAVMPSEGDPGEIRLKPNITPERFQGIQGELAGLIIKQTHGSINDQEKIRLGEVSNEIKMWNRLPDRVSQSGFKVTIAFKIDGRVFCLPERVSKRLSSTSGEGQ